MNATTAIIPNPLLEKEKARRKVFRAVSKNSSGISVRVTGMFIYQNDLVDEWKLLFPDLQEIDPNGVHYISVEEAEFAGLIEKA